LEVSQDVLDELLESELRTNALTILSNMRRTK
jgi:hypothetical protein